MKLKQNFYLLRMKFIIKVMRDIKINSLIIVFLYYKYFYLSFEEIFRVYFNYFKICYSLELYKYL